jgi:hypothetical protein
MLEQTAPFSKSITELGTQLEQFRSSHPRRTRLPQAIWQSAAGLARCHGMYVVARSLRLDYCTLKKHVSGSPESVPRQGKKTPPKFVELIGSAHERVDEYLIEFESARGRKLRIHCKSNTPPDWPALLGAWRRAER